MTDAQDDRSELLDDDVIDGEYPPEEPLGVGERLTPDEEQMGESLARRVAREVPDEAPVREDDRVGPLVAPGDEEGVDTEADAVALEADLDDETTWDVTQEREGTLPAEEAAMHLTDPPPMGDGDGYLEDEDGGAGP